MEALASVGKQNGSSEAIWFVHIPFADESYIANVFRRTPLRLDSLVFAIVQGMKVLLMLSKGTTKKCNLIQPWCECIALFTYFTKVPKLMRAYHNYGINVTNDACTFFVNKQNNIITKFSY